MYIITSTKFVSNGRSHPSELLCLVSYVCRSTTDAITKLRGDQKRRQTQGPLSSSRVNRENRFHFKGNPPECPITLWLPFTHFTPLLVLQPRDG